MEVEVSSWEAEVSAVEAVASAGVVSAEAASEAEVPEANSDAPYHLLFNLKTATDAMYNNTFGNIFRLTSFGESHGKAIGGVIDGFPAGINIDEDFIQQELNRRRPGFPPVVPSVLWYGIPISIRPITTT